MLARSAKYLYRKDAYTCMLHHLIASLHRNTSYHCYHWVLLQQLCKDIGEGKHDMKTQSVSERDVKTLWEDQFT